jgi:uncharacterized membrane protein
MAFNQGFYNLFLAAGVFALLVKGAQHTHQNLLHVGSVPSAVSTPHLARNHRRVVF